MKQKGLQSNYKKLVWTEKECMNKLKEAVLNHDIVDGKVEEDFALAKAAKATTETQEKAKEVVASIANQIFQLHSNFLSEETMLPWNKIFSEQINCSPWRNLRGV